MRSSHRREKLPEQAFTRRQGVAASRGLALSQSLTQEDRARHRAELHEMAARHTAFEITGPAEIREVDPDARSFTAQAAGNDERRVAAFQ